MISGMSSSGGMDRMREQMQNRFKKMDNDGSGSLNSDELATIAAKRGVDSSKIDKLFSRADADGDGELTLDELKGGLEKVRSRLGKGNIGGVSEFKNQLSSLMDSGDQDAIKSLMDMVKQRSSEMYGSNSESKAMLLDLIG